MLSRWGTVTNKSLPLLYVLHPDTRVDKMARDKAFQAAQDIRKAALASELLAYESRLEREKFLVDKVLDLRGQIEEGAAAKKTDLQPLRDELNAITLELTELQGEHPLLKPFVDQQTVAEVISAWTGIPAGKMVRNQIQTVLNLKSTLEERVIGQPHALEAIAQRIRTSRAGLDDPRRPIGVFLLVGTSGVGKTETALALADILYGGERNIIAINMSEYKEAHTVASLKGAAYSPEPLAGFRIHEGSYSSRDLNKIAGLDAMATHLRTRGPQLSPRLFSEQFCNAPLAEMGRSQHRGEVATKLARVADVQRQQIEQVLARPAGL